MPVFENLEKSAEFRKPEKTSKIDNLYYICISKEYFYKNIHEIPIYNIWIFLLLRLYSSYC